MTKNFNYQQCDEVTNYNNNLLHGAPPRNMRNGFICILWQSCLMIFASKFPSCQNLPDLKGNPCNHLQRTGITQLFFKGMRNHFDSGTLLKRVFWGLRCSKLTLLVLVTIPCILSYEALMTLTICRFGLQKESRLVNHQR